MLSQLLNEIAKGNALDIDGLAVRLNTSPRMIQALLEHLERNGALTQYHICNEGCSGCGMAAHCRIDERGNRLWVYEIPGK
jgi:hypothetical protein